MLQDRRVEAMIPVADFERAKTWYREKLGLEPADADEGGALYRCAEGTGFSLYPSQFAGTGQQTVMAFGSDNLEKDMQALREKGVTFEDYDLPDLKTENGMVEIGDAGRAAWFKDSEGNTLAIFQGPS